MTEVVEIAPETSEPEREGDIAPNRETGGGTAKEPFWRQRPGVKDKKLAAMADAISEDFKEAPKGAIEQATKRKPGRPPRPSTVRKEALKAQIAMVGVVVTPFNQYDGAVILKNGENLADSLCKLADENPSVARMLDAMLTASTWSQVAMGFAAVAVPIMANHGLAPAGMAPVFGCPPPPRASKGEDEESDGV